MTSGEAFGPILRRALARDPREHTDSFVYFIAHAGTGRVKIGITGDPFRRLRQIQTHSPVALKIVGVLPNLEGLEREIHAHLSQTRLHGEWFDPSQELRDIIEAAFTAATGSTADDLRTTIPPAANHSDRTRLESRMDAGIDGGGGNRTRETFRSET